MSVFFSFSNIYLGLFNVHFKHLELHLHQWSNETVFAWPSPLRSVKHSQSPGSTPWCPASLGGSAGSWCTASPPSPWASWCVWWACRGHQRGTASFTGASRFHTSYITRGQTAAADDGTPGALMMSETWEMTNVPKTLHETVSWPSLQPWKI